MGTEEGQTYTAFPDDLKRGERCVNIDPACRLRVTLMHTMEILKD